MTKTGLPNIRLVTRRLVSIVRRLSRRRLVRASAVALVLPFLAWLGFLSAVAWWPYPAEIDKLPAGATFIEDRNGTALASLVAPDGQWNIPLSEEQINPHLLDALVAVEDSRFFEHGGVDWRSAAMAAWQDIRLLHIRRGASTLTMQLERLRDPKPRSFYNKFEQAVRAAQIEKRQTKRQTLVEYANRAPFGGNLVGVGAASWRYFGRPCSQLSLAEAALLAGLPQSPSRLRPDRFPQRALARRNHVLDRMWSMAMIDQRQHDEACAEPVTAAWRPLPQDRDKQVPVADSAMPTLAWLAATHPASALRTTLDAGVQRQAARAAVEHLAKLESSGVTAAAVVVLDTETSQCLAAVSLSRTSDNVDLTRRPRSTGSTLKPFIYAAAFQSGVCTPDTALNDAPIAWAGYEPADYDRKFRGSLTAAEALAESRNIPAMVVLAKVGVEPAVGLMEAAGLKTLARSPQRYGLSLAIGGAEATPMELAQAYALLARGGTARDVKFTIDMDPTCRMGVPALRDGSLRVLDGPALSCDQMVGATDLAPSPPYSGERVGVRGDFASGATRSIAPHPSPLPRVRGRGDRKQPRVFVQDPLGTNDGPQCGPYLNCPPGLVDVSDAPTSRCLAPSACWQTLTALSGPDRTAAICPGAVKLHVAWKTGTSNGHRDAWCAAVTRRRTVVVWLGNAGGQASPALIGAEAAAPLALRLIASLDPAPADPWPVVASEPSAQDESIHRIATTSLTLISPTAGEQFVIDPDSPRDRQRILLKAALNTDTPGSGAESRTLWWFVDSKPIGMSDPETQLWWPPTPGMHEVRVIDARGHAAVAQVGIR